MYYKKRTKIILLLQSFYKSELFPLEKKNFVTIHIIPPSKYFVSRFLEALKYVQNN